MWNVVDDFIGESIRLLSSYVRGGSIYLIRCILFVLSQRVLGSIVSFTDKY